MRTAIIMLSNNKVVNFETEETVESMTKEIETVRSKGEFYRVTYKHEGETIQWSINPDHIVTVR